MTFMIGQTLRFGAREGIKVACAPLITDGFIMVAATLTLVAASSLSGLLGGISLLGALCLGWLAWDTASAVWVTPEDEAQPGGSMLKAALINALNPHPYLFWFTVGARLLTEAWERGGWVLACFLLAFYVSFVGTKIVLALLIGRLGPNLGGRGYRWTMRVIAALLLGLAIVFAHDGLQRLGYVGRPAPESPAPQHVGR
jgi:threonine/homoserine/homoserine lactone efflux protein